MHASINRTRQCHQRGATTHTTGSAGPTHSLRLGHGAALAVLLLALAGCHQGSRDATDVTPSSTARGNTSGGGSTSTGQVSGATPLGQDLPQRETSTRTGPGTPNPGPGGGGASDAGGNGTAGSGNTSGASSATGSATDSATGSNAGGTSAAGAPGAGADIIGGSGTPLPPAAPGTPHVSASGAATNSAGGIANAPGMAAGPNGHRSTSEGSPASQR